jgi:site-specific DNA-methyltransferase (adenine-specific)
MQVNKVNINEVKTNPKNPRLIKDDKFRKLVKSIQEFPQMLELRPIVVDENNIVLGGNMRLKACKEAGMKEVFIVKAENLTELQKDEFIVKDNVGFGEWDWDMLANEWDVEKIQDWGLDLPVDLSVTELEAEEDDYSVPEGGIETDIVLGDLFEIGEHRLLCGDSTCSDTVAKLMNGEKADMVFTDPPYNIDYQGVKDKRDKIANDKMSDDDFTKFIYDALNVNCDTFYVCCSWQFSHLFRKAMDDLQKPVKSFIVWDKVNPAQHLDKYFKQHEIILYHGKFGGQKTIRGDVWQTKRERNTVHPTMKPISLIEMAIKDNPDKKQIYDAFLGSGSTMVASHQLNRKCYGMELDPKYCQVIIDRMKKLDPSLVIKRNGEIIRD